MKFGVVMPVHNEEDYLPFSLPSIFSLKPDEVILLFDRCKDRSVTVAKKLIKKLDHEKKTKIVEVWDKADWRFRTAYIRRLGFKMAKNEIILTTDADTILDPKIREYLRIMGRNGVAMISFRRLEYPLCLEFFVHRILLFLHLEETFSPVYAFHKRAWLETEDLESVKKIEKGGDVHLHLAISNKFRVLYKETRCIHLRPVNKPHIEYLEGKMRWKIKRNPIWKALARSFIYLDSMGLMGYLHERFSNSR